MITGRGPQSSKVNEGIVRAVGIAVVRYDLHIVDDGDPEFFLATTALCPISKASFAVPRRP